MILGIDGPSGTGKTTIAKEISNMLSSWEYLNTGEFFRVIALEFLKFKDNKSCYDKILEIIKSIDFDIDENYNLLVNNKVIDKKQLYSPTISNIASNIVAKDLNIRISIMNHIKKIVRNKKDINFILEGRDINTVMFPNSDYKIFLSASSKCRTIRRIKQYKSNKIYPGFDKVLTEISHRDYNDISRSNAPLLISKYSIVIDTTNLTLKEICAKIIKIINEE